MAQMLVVFPPLTIFSTTLCTGQKA